MAGESTAFVSGRSVLTKQTRIPIIDLPSNWR
ncbi:hypothetical protein V1281_006430 [Nitrobacteraceae bacterium AZCC 2161]